MSLFWVDPVIEQQSEQISNCFDHALFNEVVSQHMFEYSVFQAALYTRRGLTIWPRRPWFSCHSCP